MFGEVGRRGDEHTPAGRQAMGDKTAIADGTVTDHGVVSDRGDVYEPVVELERQGDPGVLLQERDQRRRKVQAAEADRRGQPQRPDQLAASLRQLVAAVLRLLKNASRTGQEGAAILGERHLAGGALDQARAKFMFKVGQAFADHGLGQTQAPGGLAD